MISFLVDSCVDMLGPFTVWISDNDHSFSFYLHVLYTTIWTARL